MVECKFHRMWKSWSTSELHVEVRAVSLLYLKVRPATSDVSRVLKEMATRFPGGLQLLPASEFGGHGSGGSTELAKRLVPRIASSSTGTDNLKQCCGLLRRRRAGQVRGEPFTLSDAGRSVSLGNAVTRGSRAYLRRRR